MNIWLIIWDSGLVVKFILLLLIILSIVSWGIVFHYRKLYLRIDSLNTEFLKVFLNTKASQMSTLSELNDKIDALLRKQEWKSGKCNNEKVISSSGFEYFKK